MHCELNNNGNQFIKLVNLSVCTKHASQPTAGYLIEDVTEEC